MINATELARGFIEELRQYVARADLTTNRGTVTDVEEKYSLMIPRDSLPTVEPTAQVIEALFWASMLFEEQRACRPRLTYNPYAALRHKFSTPAALDKQSLRSLSQVQGAEGALHWTDEGDQLTIVGVGDPATAHTIRVLGPGKLVFDLLGYRLAMFSDGEFHRYSQPKLLTRTSIVTVMRDHVGVVNPVDVLWTMDAIRTAGHGGSIWITSIESTAGLSIGRELDLSSSRPLQNHFVDDVSHFLQGRKAWSWSVGQLGALDGAILIGLNGSPRGFSTFIDAAPPDRVERVLPDGQTCSLASIALGGGRHRSAAAFCRRFAPAAALVVSTDDRTAMLYSRRDGQVMYLPFNDLGLLTDDILFPWKAPNPSAC